MRFERRNASSVLKTIFGLLLLLPACAGPGKRLESPRVTLAHIEVQEAQVFETIFSVELRIFNTNDIPIEVKGLDCDIELNGRKFATGISDAKTQIPAYGTAKIPITLYSSVVDMVRGFLRVKDREALNYRIKGRIRVQGGLLTPSVVPFESEGEISLEGIKE